MAAKGTKAKGTVKEYGSKARKAEAKAHRAAEKAALKKAHG